ncbi:6,7-dimethyl-8-ribityllumazine synthase [Roseibacillus ishigakijimensis]|uniref:6,7-dimethyl-8-ribityllumazine synthase n=1 Tax=Roseibacillus ishigakijimensis TaxID=454146 RepID=A0A934RQL6_9BACT|nr:6,7-dimethyl-8-ribityllumazine synthase [Roseibacillus ishigakijimensis]MBK1834072.1 6,7-dimethyl-8-ribityllumazine synthase [Roseibacillus ishigakijimensis]
MSFSVPPKPRIMSGGRNKIAIVASQFNEEYVEGLVESCLAELGELIPNARVDLIRVPGAFEIPLACKLVLENEECEAIVCLGVIIEGATAHADLVAESVTDSLLNLSVAYGKPVIHEVLLVKTHEQAKERCLEDNDLNRGRDAARAAAGMIEVCKELTRNAK